MIDWSDAGAESLQFHLTVLGKQHVLQMYQEQQHVEHEIWYDQLIAGGCVAIAHGRDVKDMRLCDWALLPSRSLMSFPTGCTTKPKRFAMGCLLLSVIACYIGHMQKHSTNPCWKERFARWKKFAEYSSKGNAQQPCDPVPASLARRIVKDINIVIETACSPLGSGCALYSKQDINTMLSDGTTLTQIKPLLQLLSLRVHIASKEEGFCWMYTFPAD